MYVILLSIFFFFFLFFWGGELFNIQSRLGSICGLLQQMLLLPLSHPICAGQFLNTFTHLNNLHFYALCFLWNFTERTHPLATHKSVQTMNMLMPWGQPLTNGGKSEWIISFSQSFQENFCCAFSTDLQKVLIECTIMYC